MIQPGQVVGLLGESGGGKTTAILAMLGLLPAGAVAEGSALFRGVELIGAPEDTMRAIRGARISCIPQEPRLSLNPVIRVIDQVAMVVQAHERLSARGRRDRARTALEQAGLHGSELHNSYAHQLSGGQRQRVLIAQAIVCRPSLLIADEPTGSLDAPSAREILSLLRGLVKRMDASLLLITHDPSVAGYIADRVMVMYAGRIVEDGPAKEVLQAPMHPYTQGLLRCLLDPRKALARSRDRRVAAIDGAPPDFHHLPPGCSFQPRCPDRMPACVESEPPPAWSASRQTRCFLYGPPR
jgi:peptide/nickel transport system ATP-binding protein